MADGVTPPRPKSAAERIDAIDVLRGIALLGVLAINVVNEFRVSIFEQFLFQKPASSTIDRAIEAILTLAVEMKAFALFSMLFGVGLAIQFERLADSEHRAQLLIRRLAVLLAFGLAHLCLIWNGDILTEYALAGLIVLPFLYGPRWLLAATAVVFLTLYFAMQAFPPAGLFPDSATIRQQVANATRVYSTGGLLEVLTFRLREIPLILPLHVFIFPRTIGLFLLGAYAWRKGILQESPWRLLSIGVACIGTGGATIFAGAQALGTILLALGYGAAIIGTANLASGKSLLGWAAPLGRMAFTNYLAQSLVLGWIFYGYGLGLFGKLGVTSALGIAIAVYLVQGYFSAWWLGRYRYGPVEWLWRTLMYGEIQPMTLTSAAKPANL